MERAMLTALAVCVGGLELVLRELVLPALALAMASTGMTWGGCGDGRGEGAGCCAPAIQPQGLGEMKVLELRQVARARGLRALARSGRRADLLEALGA
jgi:hypothetical protein